MPSHSRAASEDEISEVVRRRLETLLAQIPARRVLLSGSAQHAIPDELEQQGFVDGEPHEGDPDAAVSDEAPGPADPAPTSVALRLSGLPEGFGLRARQFVREHLVVIGIIVLAGCLWGAYSMFQARTSAVAVAAPAPSVQVSVPAMTPSPSATLLVHVLGEVRRPGVVSLPDGARVQDAIASAGGLTKRARPGELNLAARVTDGAQLVIGRSGSSVNGSVAAGGNVDPAAAIDLNTATLAQLDTLPGVGPVTAQKILSWREQHGRFRSVAELQEVDGIGPKSYAQIASRVRV